MNSSNGSSTVVPINPETETAVALIKAKDKFSLSQLALLPTHELRALQRQWYDQAVAGNVITLLQILLMQAGKADNTGTQMVWEQGGIHATYDLASNSLMIKVNGALVCATYSKGNEVFVPGHWLATAINALDRIEIETKRDQEALELGERRDLVGLLGAKV